MRGTTSFFKRRVLAWLLTLAWAGLIFFLSAQPAAAFPEIPLLELLSGISHFSLYAVLTALLVRALRVGSKLAARPAWVIGLVLIALYGLSDEFHQSFVPGRTPDVVDWLTDVAGGLAAWWFLFRRERRQTVEAGETRQDA